MPGASSTPSLLLAASAAAVLAAVPASAQSVLDRTPNLSGAWTGPAGVAHFNFLHRFSVLDGPADKVRNSPTFLAAYAPVDGLLLGTRYATNSTLDPQLPNEWEPFARWSPLREADGRPVQLGVQVAWNSSASSLDGAVEAARRVGPVRLIAVARAFEDAFATGDAAVAIGGGLVLALGPVAVAGDALRTLDAAAGADDVAWGVGLQLPLPYTPHTVSLQATNTNTATLQGASLAAGETRYGFEFTIPLTLRRYFGRRAPEGPSRAHPPGAVGVDTVEVRMRGLRFEPARLEIRPGTLVRWINEDPVGHTVTFAERPWDSGLLERAGSWELVFEEEGEFDYHCVPHPFMRAVVVVRAGGDP
ncbi:MAG TPA: cupredoxin family copper-binding protein [Longimicrobiales bacterium]|nr:cupredoxin family copper-binding protein [Longimicrobiales bacterium]